MPMLAVNCSSVLKIINIPTKKSEVLQIGASAEDIITEMAGIFLQKARWKSAGKKPAANPFTTQTVNVNSGLAV